MDQLRKILGWLKQQHFWVLSVLVVLIGLACWWMASGTLRQLYENNQRQIKEGFNGLDTLRSQPFHPNKTINDKQTEETRQQAENVAAIWEKLYERQKEHVLNWPSGPGELSPEFVAYVEKLDFGADIPAHLREHYQNYIFRHFPKLPQKINARELKEGETSGLGGEQFRRGRLDGGPEMGAVGGFEDDGDYICEWLDQAAVRDELEFPQQPSPLRIWVTQENLWVYHTLLDVIKNTNEAAGATRMSNAAVRVIHSLEVGRRAAPHSRTPGRLSVPVMATTSPEGEGMVPGMEGGLGSEAGMAGRSMVPGHMEYGAERYGEGLGGAPVSPEQESAMLLSYRYLDAEGRPIGGGAGGEAGAEAVMPDMTGAAATPVDLNSLGTEYKRLPVRMVLEMDLRHLPFLISNCAIQSLQVEVQEVRINPGDAGGLAGGGFDRISSPSRFGEGRFGSGGSSFGDRAELQQFRPQPHIATVVIQGVIYIFKKPDPSVLQPAEEGQVAGL